MTAAGVVAVDVVGFVLLLWVLNLVRLGRLYVGYAAFFVSLIVFGVTAASLPPLRRPLAALVQILFPEGGATTIAFAFVLFLLIYILAQMTILSNRVSAVVQDLAISRSGAPGARDASTAAETPQSRP